MIWAVIASAVAIATLIFRISADARAARARSETEARLREEFEAYSRLDLSFPAGGSPRHLARRVCASVSAHRDLRSALLVRDAERRLRVAGSAGMDDVLLAALENWGKRFVHEQPDAPPAKPNPCKSYAITLGPLERFDPKHFGPPRGVCQMCILPLWSAEGVMLGALAVCSQAGDRMPLHDHAPAALEALAAALARSAEHQALSDRLLRAEKMAGLAQLARGLAHEINNPLTAVLGFAELIVESTSEPATRQDAASIMIQADRMRSTIDSLVQFWRPSVTPDRTVDLGGLLVELTARYEPELRRRNIRLLCEIDATAAGTPLRGHKDKLVQLFEHLLTNSAQSIEATSPATPAPVPVAVPSGESGPALFSTLDPASEPDRAIRVTLAAEANALQVVISDTGSGFSDPARVFDPFYTTRPPGDGPGMGLSLSYSIVREHGGEISAFNLSPRGAAIVVELPINRALRHSGEHAKVA